MTSPAEQQLPPALPVLFSVRGWLQEVNPAYVTFVEEMRATGADVVDIYVPPAGFRSFGDWANAIVEKIVDAHPDNEPLHLMCYCLGGSLMLVVLTELERRGIRPAFVSIIDAREYSPRDRLHRGLDALNLTPWPVRLRGLLVRLTPPDRETLGAVTTSVVRRAIRSTIELPKRGWRSRKRRIPAVFDELVLAYGWEFDAISTPVHLYNTQASMDLYAPGNPSLNIGKYLQGGFVVRMIEGNHENCIETPHASTLIDRITIDRIAVVHGAGVFQ